MPKRTRIFLVLLFVCILTMWVPAHWPVALFLSGMFLLTIADLARRTDPPQTRGRLAIAVLTLLSCVPLWAFLQIAFGITVYAEPTRVALLGTLSYACVIYLVSGVPAQSIDRVRRALLWFAFVVSVVAILQNATSGKIFWVFPIDDPALVMGPIVYHNHWAAFVEVALPIAICYALQAGTRSLWLHSAMAATLYASVIASASRSGLIICTSEILLIPLLIARRAHHLPAGLGRALIALAGALVLFAAVVDPGRVIERLRADPTVGRADWNRSSLAMIRDHAWGGVGVGDWPIVYPQYAKVDHGRFVNQAHNDWLQWAAEGGVFYAGIFLAVAAYACGLAWIMPWSAGVAAVFCQAAVDYPFSRPVLAGWTLTVLGLSLASLSVGDSAPDKLPESYS